jgi:hypothetical protein
VAQAEFYFADANATPDSYLWAMKWTARLRPFRLPLEATKERSAGDIADAVATGVDEAMGTFRDACAVANIIGDWSCDDLDLESIADLITH